MAGLAERAEAVRAGSVPAEKDNMLLITNDGRKIALDQRLADPALPDFEGSKVNACCENVLRIWRDGAEERLTQLVFCDLSTRRATGPSTCTTICAASSWRAACPRARWRSSTTPTPRRRSSPSSGR